MISLKEKKGKNKMLLLRKLIVISILSFLSFNAYAVEKCRDLPGFKTLGKDTAEYLECLAKKPNLQIKTESKMTDIVTGKKKFKLPNPINGLKNIGKALKPSALEKK